VEFSCRGQRWKEMLVSCFKVSVVCRVAEERLDVRRRMSRERECISDMRNILLLKVSISREPKERLQKKEIDLREIRVWCT
jgi:ubiquinone biosynthesis protein UbiJ